MASFYCTLSPVDGDGYATTACTPSLRAARMITPLSGSSTCASPASEHLSSIPRQSAAGRAHSSARSQGSHRARHTVDMQHVLLGRIVDHLRLQRFRQPRHTGGSGGGSAKAVINVGTYAYPNWKRYRAIVNIGTYYNTNWLSVRPVNNYGSYSQPDWR